MNKYKYLIPKKILKEINFYIFYEVVRGNFEIYSDDIEFLMSEINDFEVKTFDDLYFLYKEKKYPDYSDAEFHALCLVAFEEYIKSLLGRLNSYEN